MANTFQQHNIYICIVGDNGIVTPHKGMSKDKSTWWPNTKPNTVFPNSKSSRFRLFCNCCVAYLLKIDRT